MIFERFDVVVVNFPFVDAPKGKPKPTLILSSSRFNRANRHTVLAMSKRAAHTRWPSDHVIDDLTATGLRHSSVMRWKLFTLDNRMIQRRIGALAQKDRASCAVCIAAALGLAP